MRIPAVRVVDEHGEQIGVMDTRDAIAKARDIGLDLVEIAPQAKPPVCRIIDYGKFLYEEKKKQQEAKKKQTTVSVKEIKFRPATDDHDYQYRMERARGWIEDGDKVRGTISFRGREMSHRELGAEILERLHKDLKDIADVEVRPKMEGYQMFIILSPKKT
ncbi:MAG: translation initiation factor IF-3 [Acidobacteriota bacterium]|nr:translation initiation factor IF-3 [Acidobacteriota bacterium]